VATTPRLAAEDDLAAVNAAESIVAQAAWFVGPALGAAMVALLDVRWAFMVDAVTFLVSRAGDLGGGPASVTEQPEPESDDDSASKGSSPG
jgi:hypothetical protein